MAYRIPALALVLGCACLAADKKLPAAQAENQTVALTAVPLTDKEAIRQELGSDLGGYFVVVKVTVRPRGGKPLAVHRDDFVLRSLKDGQKSTPFVASQIAGKGALVISERGGGRGMMAEEGGPAWGGIGGPPGRLGGDGGSFGNTAGASAQASVHAGGKDKEDPLVHTLKEKALPENQTTEPVSGLLYFPIEGKHKPKDLELIYRGPGGKLSLSFRK